MFFSWWRKKRKPIEERTFLELVGVFILLPIAFGGILLGIVLHLAVHHGETLTLTDWIGQIVFGGLLGISIAVALPTVAVVEIRRRARSGNPSSSSTTQTKE